MDVDFSEMNMCALSFIMTKIEASCFPIISSMCFRIFEPLFY